MDIKKAVLERGDLRVDHFIVSRPRVGCVAVCRLDVTASFEGMNARLEDVELHDGVFFQVVDALKELRVLSTLSHCELENTRVDVMLDDIVQLGMAVEIGKMVASYLDEDFFHAARLGLNVGDQLICAFEGFLRAFKGVDDVAHVRIEVTHLVLRLTELFTELFHDGDALGERFELDRRGIARLLIGDGRLNFGMLLGGGFCLI